MGQQQTVNVPLPPGVNDPTAPVLLRRDVSNSGDSTIPVSSGESAVEASAGAALQGAKQSTALAQQRLQQTSPYSTGASATATMPQPKRTFFNSQGAVAGLQGLAGKQVATRAGQRAKTIGEIAALGAGIIGKYQEKKEAEKVQNLTMDINKTMDLHKGIQEATQVAEQAQAVLNDPNSTPQEKAQANQMLTQSKQTLTQNQNLLNAVLNGKNAKDIFKAYDVTFGPESKEMSPEDHKDSMHSKAMQASLKQQKEVAAKQAQTMQGAPPNMGQPALPNVQRMNNAQQFESHLPLRTGINPEYTSRLAQFNAALKAQDTAQKEFNTVGVQAEHDRTRLKEEGMKEEAAAQRTRMQVAERWEASKLSYAAALARAAATRYNGWARIKAAQAGEGIKAATDVYNQTIGQIKEVDGRIQQLMTEKQNLTDTNKYGSNPALEKEIDTSLQQYQAERKQLGNLAYASNLLMRGDPDGNSLTDLSLGPGYPSDPAMPPPLPEKKPGLIKRGATAIGNATGIVPGVRGAVSAGTRSYDYYKETHPSQRSNDDEE